MSMKKQWGSFKIDINGNRDMGRERYKNCFQPRSSQCRNKCYLFIKTVVHPRGRKCTRLGFSSWVPGLSPANDCLRALGKSSHLLLPVLHLLILGAPWAKGCLMKLRASRPPSSYGPCPQMPTWPGTPPWSWDQLLVYFCLFFPFQNL